MVDFKSLQNLKKFINKYNLLEKDDKVLIAFSGGPDSVFLFHCLYILRDEYNLELYLAYINHNLREDVDKDIEFVKEFSKKYNTKLYIESANIKQIALDKKISEEEAGREERYKIFSHIVKENNLNKIATGHNLDDNVETFIFRLIRGTSLNGLKGIPVKRKNIIRPILEFRKDKIIDFLEKHNEEYRIDTTNLESKYTRNKIRNLIFPLFNDINPLFREKIIDLIGEINTLDIKKNSDRELMIKNLLDLNEYEQNEKIFNLVSQYDIDINREKIRQIRKLIYSNGNKEINLGNSFILYKNYDKLKVITKNSEKFLEDKILVLGQSIEWGNYLLELKEVNKVINKEKSSIIFNENIDIIVRSRKEGDKIYLKNLGYKKIKKILIDEKVEKKDRDLIPIIEVNNEIVAVGDIRIADREIPTKQLEGIKYVKLIIRRKDAK